MKEHRHSILLFFQGMAFSDRDRGQYSKALMALLREGILLQEALYMHANKNRNLIFEVILKDIQRGGCLWQAFSRHRVYFPPFMVHMVRFGEDSGALLDSFEALSLYYEERHVLKKQLLFSLLYPLLLFLCLLILLFYGLPLFLESLQGFFEALAKPFPTHLQKVQRFYKWFWRLPWVVVPCFALIFGLLLRFICWKRMGRALPFLGPFLKRVFFQHYFHALFLQTRSGVSLPESVSLLEEVFDDPLLRGQSMRIKSGCFFSESLSFFEGDLQRRLMNGEQSGRLVPIFGEIEKSFQKEIQWTLNRLPKILSSLFVIIVGLLLIIIINMVFYPIYGALDTIST